MLFRCFNGALRTAIACLLAVAVAGFGGALSAQAQPFPSAPVKLIVTTGAGSGPDVIARIVADDLARLWGQQVFVVNHPGAAGALGMKVAGSAPPDGHTLLFAQSSSFVALPEIQSTFPYDLLRDFVPIGFVGEQPMAFAVSPTLGVGTLAQLIDLARSKPEAFNVAVLSRGGMSHLTAELLMASSGTTMTVVNYSGAPQALADVLGGRMQVIIDGLPGLSGNSSGGTIKVIAIGSEQRLQNLPDVPTAAETLPGFKARGFFALMGTPGTPQAIAAKISEDLRKVLAEPRLIAKFHEIATYPKPLSPAELVAYLQAEQQAWKPIMGRPGLRIGK